MRPTEPIEMDAKGKATLNVEGGKSLEVPVYGGTIGPDVVDIRTLYGKTGLFTYDPGFLSTAACSSKITVRCPTWHCAYS